MFNWFKKKENTGQTQPSYDPNNIPLNKLRKGSFLDYDLKTWEVKAVYEYDWGNDYFADEFQLEQGREIYFLYVEEDGEFYCTLNKRINPHELPEDVLDTTIEKGSPPMRIQFQEEIYYRQSENMGYNRSSEQTEWSELISWSYANKAEDKLMTLEQWGDQDFQASVGFKVRDIEFSNIIMP